MGQYPRASLLDRLGGCCAGWVDRVGVPEERCGHALVLALVLGFRRQPGPRVVEIDMVLLVEVRVLCCAEIIESGGQSVFGIGILYANHLD